MSFWLLAVFCRPLFNDHSLVVQCDCNIGRCLMTNFVIGQSLSGHASKFNRKYVEFGLMNRDFFGIPGLPPLVLAVITMLGVELPTLLLAIMCA